MFNKNRYDIYSSITKKKNFIIKLFKHNNKISINLKLNFIIIQ